MAGGGREGRDEPDEPAAHRLLDHQRERGGRPDTPRGVSGSRQGHERQGASPALLSRVFDRVSWIGFTTGGSKSHCFPIAPCLLYPLSLLIHSSILLFYYLVFVEHYHHRP